MNGLVILAICCVLYVFSGGRWTLAVAAFTIGSLSSSKTARPRKKPPTSQKKTQQSPVYSIDFTTTGVNSTPTASTRQQRVKRSTKVTKATKPTKVPQVPSLTASTTSLLEGQIYVFYTTLTGSSKRVAQSLVDKLTGIDELKRKPLLVSLDDEVDDLEEYFLKTPSHKDDPTVKNIYLLVLPSYETDSPIDYFLEHLVDTYQDFRVDKYPLRSLLGFSVLGLGDSESWGETDKFCYQAKLADRWMAKLGGRRLYPVGEVCMKFEGEPKAQAWINNFASLLVDDEPFYLDLPVDDSDAENSSDAEVDTDADTLVDVEDMGDIIRKTVGSSSSRTPQPQLETKQMVAKDSPTYKSLTKQGYTIVGSHSGVKICRWTKSALRGRGS